MDEAITLLQKGPLIARIGGGGGGSDDWGIAFQDKEQAISTIMTSDAFFASLPNQFLLPNFSVPDSVLFLSLTSMVVTSIETPFEFVMRGRLTFYAYSENMGACYHVFGAASPEEQSPRRLATTTAVPTSTIVVEQTSLPHHPSTMQAATALVQMGTRMVMSSSSSAATTANAGTTSIDTCIRASISSQDKARRQPIAQRGSSSSVRSNSNSNSQLLSNPTLSSSSLISHSACSTAPSTPAAPNSRKTILKRTHHGRNEENDEAVDFESLTIDTNHKKLKTSRDALNNMEPTTSIQVVGYDTRK